MATTSPNSLLDAIRQHRLLDFKQLEEMNGLSFPDPKSLAKELIQRGWLTPYQANQLLTGKGHELVLGSYILLERLGEGGMGQVFKARHRTMGRIAAIKLIRKERLDNANAIKRFQREVRSAAALSHPNIVLAYDADEIAGTHLMVMEYIDAQECRLVLCEVEVDLRDVGVESSWGRRIETEPSSIEAIPLRWIVRLVLRDRICEHGLRGRINSRY